MQGSGEWTNNKSQQDIPAKSRHDRSAGVIAPTRGNHDATHHAPKTYRLPDRVESIVTMNVSSADRLLTLYLFRPILRRLGAERQFRIPILMYHSVSGQTAKGNRSYFSTKLLFLTPGCCVFGRGLYSVKYIFNHTALMSHIDPTPNGSCTLGSYILQPVTG